MQAIDRWRKWTPAGNKFGKPCRIEPTKPTKLASVSSVSSIPEQVPDFFDGPTAHDFHAWSEDFHKWALSECCFRDRCFGGIGALCAEFGRWAVEHDSVPCTRATFESWLRDQGFFCADGMVSGLILKADLWAVEGRNCPTVNCSLSRCQRQ